LALTGLEQWMDWNNSHPQAMDGLEQCPSLTLQTTVCKIQFYICPADWNFPADKCNAIFPYVLADWNFSRRQQLADWNFSAGMKQLVADKGICF